MDTKKNINTNIKLLITSFIYFYLNCNGIGGSEVIPKENFEKNAESYFLLRAVDCQNQYPKNNNQESSTSENTESGTNNSALIGLLSSIGNGVGGFFQFGKSSVNYITIKDANFCYLTLFTTPCGNNFSDFLSSAVLNYNLYCKPKIACFLDKQHILQGNICY
ncbi:MAG: hypothetical protein MH321_03145 [Leptospiraceae bacterium]|nr:hypothetical protein [Leptospiraceae bacterium]